MLSDDEKQTIDALPMEELQLEVNKGTGSRFQREKFAYLKSRLQELQDNEAAARHGAELDLAAEANRISSRANDIADEANRTASKAWRASILAVVVALVAIVVTMCSQK